MAGAMALACTPALAQGATSGEGASSLSTIVVAIITPLVTALAGWGVKQLSDRTVILKNEAAKAVVEDALDYAIGRMAAYAEARGKTLVESLKTNDTTLGVGVRYAEQAANDAMQRLNIKPAEIPEKILARIGMPSAPEASERILARRAAAREARATPKASG